MDVPVAVGQVVGGKYEVERVLAQGGVGVVVRAKHVQLLEPCAIKFMLPEALETPMARERFLREARACARLKSDHVVKVFDVGELDGGIPYIVLEYLEGVDLEARLDTGPLPVGEAVLYVLQICAALAEAHALGIVHRDIKPGNVFLATRADGTTRAKLLDFGISKVVGEKVGGEEAPTDQAQTMEGTVMGTPFFMAPEQARGEAVDGRTDVWAVGVLLFHLLTGLFPFEGKAPFKTLQMILKDTPVPPSHHTPGIPPEIDRIFLWCLEKDPANRPAGVHEIATALAPFAKEEGLPLSLHVRRVFESSVEFRTSQLPPAPPTSSPPVSTSPTSSPPASSPEPQSPPVQPVTMGEPPSFRGRARWRVPAAVSALLAAVAIGVSLAPRSPGPAPAALPSVEPQPIVQATPPATTVADTAATSEPSATAVKQDAPPAKPTASASSAPHVPPPRTSATPGPVVSPRSAGFDLGSRR